MPPPALLKKWLSPVLLLLALWLALVALSAGQFIVAVSWDWDRALEIGVKFWLPWLPLLPLTAWLAWRFPLERTRLALSIVVHLAACAVVVLVCQAATTDRPQGPDRASGPGREAGREAPGPPRGDGGGTPREGGPQPRTRGQRQGPPGGDRRGPPPRGMWRPIGFRSVIDIIVYGGVVSLTHAIAFLRRSQQRERRALELEASLSRARLDALRLQINPHFLFNALNAIASLVHTRPADADEMIGSLSELLRASLHGAGHHEVPLCQEMEMLRLFTDIESTRFGGRIRFVDDIAPDTTGALVPSLILQPLVENAIRHGLEPRVDAGTVTVRARRSGDRLILSVSDDGAGFSPDNSPANSDGPGGIGLANTRDRLRALYGDDQRLTIDSVSPGGTTVSLDIPFHTAAAVA